ncbi:MAG: DUF6531 domain-containing protein [Pseudomonadales bacterium]|nr:DUF6531 domain-containing protein [Pseudomonadales bacterium]
MSTTKDLSNGASQVDAPVNSHTYAGPRAIAATAHLSDSAPSPRLSCQQNDHAIDVQYLFNDLAETPVGEVPYRLICRKDRSEVHTGTLTADGRLKKEGLQASTYDLELIPQEDVVARQEAEQLRKEFIESLNAIVINTQNMTHIEESMLDQMHWAESGLVYTGAFLQGAWDTVYGFGEFIAMVGSTLASANQAYLELWQDIVTGNFNAIEEKIKNNNEAAQRFFSDSKENFEKLILLVSDREVRQALYDFPRQYWDALSSVEKTRVLASLGTDIALEILIAVVSGGLAVPAQLAKAARGASKLIQNAINALEKLAKALKKIKPRKKVRVPVNKPKKVYLNDPPDKHLAINHGGSTTKPGTTDAGKTSPSIEKTKTSGEPISMVTGEEILALVDFKIPGLLPLTWQRVYRSGNNQNRGLGYGWTHPLNEKLLISGNHVIFQNCEGRLIELPTPEVGEFSSNETEGLFLHREYHQHFILKQPGQPNKQFFALLDHTDTGKAQLVTLSDDVGNYWQVEYCPEFGYPIALHSSWKTQVRFAYTDGLISRVEFISKTHQHILLAEYLYDETRDLISATDKSRQPEHYQYTNHVLVQRTLKTGYNFYLKWNQYNHQGQCIEQWGDNGNYHYKFEWDDKNKVSRSIDSNGGVLTVHYNDAGLVTQEISPTGAITDFAYDQANRLIKKTNPNGHYFEYKYDDFGNLTTYLDPAGGGYSIFYDNEQRPIGFSDGEGNSWDREFNNQGLITKSTTPEGHETQYFYNSQGLPITIINPEGNKRFLEWNDQGELIADSHGIVDLQSPGISQFQHDALGQITEVVQGNHKTKYQYDQAGNVTAITYPDGSQIQMCYNPAGQLTTFIDGAGKSTHFEYDGLSQITKRINAAGHSFHYHYDQERNLTGLTNEKGERYQLIYDADERLIQEIGFDGRVQQYAYDAAGFLIKHTEGKQATDETIAANSTQFHRDPVGRLIQKLSPDGDITNFAYNSNGALLEATNKDRTLQFEYSPSGKLAKEIQDGHSLIHQYDHFGNRTQTELPNGDSIQYEFNRLGQLEGVLFNHALITKISHNPFGQEQYRQQGALTSQWDYDPMGRLTQHTVTHQQNQHKVVARSYQYDSGGNLAEIDDFLKGTTRYHYDALNQLTAVESMVNETFSFDPAGNITQGQNESGGNRLAFFGDRHFRYDERGNLIEERRGKSGRLMTQYHYNMQNQLIKVERSKERFEYRYDALGRRISKKDAFGETLFLWNGDVLLSEERNHQKRLYLYEPNSFRPLAHIENNQCYFYHLDHLGTPQEISDWNGRIVWSGKYKAYGNLALKQAEEVENNIRFQGQYYDVETGLHYNRHRYYDPNSARFINQDPISLSGGTNNYRYTENPSCWIDPLGLTAKEPNCSAGVGKLFKYTNTKEMDPEYRGEELGTAPAWEPFGANVQYLNETERQQYKVKVANGLLTDANGMLLDSADTINGKLMFVMDQNGDIYAGPQRIMEFHHSSFLSGNPVAAAGELEIAHGQILTHSRKSGHYKPNKEHHSQFIAEMNEKGIDLSNAYEDPVE